MDVKKYVVDTNILLDRPEIIKQHNCILLSGTLRELEKHKRHPELGFKARQACRVIDEYMNVENFDLKDYTFNLNKDFDTQYVDNQILAACINNNYGIITEDILLKQKCKAFGVEVLEIKDKQENEYTGWLEVELSESEYNELISSIDVNHYNLKPNQYLIVYNITQDEVFLLMWNGRFYENVEIKPIKNKYIEIYPKDLYQKAFIHMLQNQKALIKITNSPYGCGKSFLMLHWSLHMLEKGKINKLYFVKADNPPNGRKSFPAIPGGINEKCEPLVGVIKDSTSENDLFEILLRNEKIEILPIQFAKGRSLSNAIMLINEAQDFTPVEMEKLLSRMGENSYVLIDGSNQQIDNQYCLDKSGLIAVIDNFKNEEIAAQVNLVNDYRSQISKLVSSKVW